MRLVVSWMLVGIGIAIFANLTVTAIVESPRKRYQHNGATHPLSVDCESVPVDATLSDVIQLLNQHGEATLERLQNDRLVVQRENIQCVVELSAVTRRSTKAETVKLPAFAERM
jgi:hypothetical protein